MSPKPSHTNQTTLVIITLLLLTHQTKAYITLTQIRTLITLSHSLSTRVATLRLSRGDTAGAHRAKLIANKLEIGVGLRLWPTALSMVWDYVRNYAWRDSMSYSDAVGFAADVNHFLSLVTDFTNLRDHSHRPAWVAANYPRLFRVSKSLFSRLLSVFTKSGPLREFIETLQKEMEGDFLKDCLEVGFNDLKGVVQILKDLSSQYTNSGYKQEL